jgi:steroid delta-isomerase-like uncharacterized protein
MSAHGIARKLASVGAAGLVIAIVGYGLLDSTTPTAIAEHHEEAVSAEVDVAKGLLHAFNKSDWDTFGALISDDHVYVEHGTQRTIEGRDALLEALAGWKTAMPDVVGTPSAYLQGGSSVAMELVWTGTHTGPLMTPAGELPASGKEQTTPGVWILDIEDGKAVASRNYFDMMTLLQQIGAMPAAE